MDEFTDFLKFYHFESFEDAIRESGAECLDDLKELETDDINELCDDASMNDDQKNSFVNACTALKNEEYPPNDAPVISNDQSKPQQLDAFLTQYKLIQFSQSLQKNGLSRLEVLKSMNDADIKAIAKKSKLGVLQRKKFIAACNDFQNGVYIINDPNSDSNGHVVHDDPSSIVLPKNVTLVDVCHSRSSILECKSYARLLQILSFYDGIKQHFEKENKEKGFNLLIDYVNEAKIDMAQDLGHVVQCHFNDKKKKQMQQNKEFGLAYAKLRTIFGCDLEQCQNFGRNNRDRATDKLSNEKEVNFIVDLLDSIHVLFCHSYDTGYRMMGMKYISYNDGAAKDDDKEFKVNCLDDKFQEISKKMKKIRDKMTAIRGLERIEHNKFNNEIVVVQEVVDEKKKEMKEKERGDMDRSRYSFGLRCYYWDYYKDNDDEDRHYHPRQSYGQWFVPPKHKDLKQEITQNYCRKLTLACYRAVMQKASEWWHTAVVQKMKAECGFDRDDNADRCDEYQVKQFSPVKLDYLICLVCYTDYTKFSYDFSKSFRKINAKETDQEFIIRKQNYHWLSKGLRELIELYGTMMQASQLKKFFTGISCEVVFSKFVCRLYGPTSTTAQISVATVFATRQGMIITLNKNYNGGRLCYFDCSMISCYKSEDERLFIGGLRTIQFGTIRSVKSGKNFKNFIKPISKFCQTLSRTLDPENKPNKYDSKVIGGLIEHYLGIRKNKFDGLDPLINQLFKAIVQNTKLIQIDVRSFKKNCKASEFAWIFCSKMCKNMLKIYDLTKIFINLHSVCLQWKGCIAHFCVDAECLGVLYSELLKCESNSSLQEIKILNIENEFEYVDKEWKEFLLQVTKIGFVAKVEQRYEGEDDEQIPCLIIERA